MASSKKRKVDVATSGVRDAASKENFAKSTVKRRRTTKRKKSTAASEDLLMKLPSELRNEIYELVLPHDETIYLRARGHTRGDGTEEKAGRWREPSLLLVSRTIRDEATKLYYQTNEFAFTGHSTRIEKIESFLHAKTDKGEGKRVQICWSVRILWPALAQIPCWLALAKAIYNTSSKYLAQEPVRNSRHDSTVQYIYGNLAVREVGMLASEANLRSLSYKDLEQDFLDWASAKISTAPNVKRGGAGLRAIKELSKMTGNRAILEEYVG